MAVNLPSADFVTSSLSGALAQAATTATIGAGLNLPATNGVLQIDYDSTTAVGATNGPETVTYATYNSSTGALTGLTRGLAGTSDVAHDNARSVQSGPSVLFWSQSTIGVSNGGNLLKNGNLINNAANGYGGTPDDWSNSSANPVQGGFLAPAASAKSDLISLLGILDGDIEGLWLLDEASGNATDYSSNVYTLTDNNTVDASSDGLIGKARDFESGNSEYFSIADASVPSLEIAGSKTIFALVKPESVGATQIVASKFKNTVSGGYALSLYFDGTKLVPSFTCRGHSTNTSVTGDQAIQAGKWYFVAGVYDSSNNLLKVWINGVKKQVTSSGATTDSDAIFALGADHNGGANAAANFMDGLIQYAGVLSVALTDDQIKRLWAATNYKGIKLRRATTNAYVYQTLPQDLVERLRGKQVTLRASYYQAVASTGQVSISDGSESASDTSTNTAQWQTASVTKTISATATSIEIRLKHSTTDGSTWFKEVALYEGSNILPFVHSYDDWDRFSGLLRLTPYSLDAFAYFGKNLDKCRLTKSTNQSINNTTETAITWDTEEFDSNDLHSLTSNTSRITAQKAGFYLIIGDIAFAGHSDAGQRYASLVYNGGTAIATASITNVTGTADVRHLQVSAIYYLKAGRLRGDNGRTRVGRLA
jgi:hypothetical protein